MASFEFTPRPAGSTPFDVVGYGENSLDFVAEVSVWPGPDTKAALASFRVSPGGQVATAVAACAQLGLRARYIGVVGDDDWGREVAAGLESRGIAATLVRRRDTSTRAAVVLVDATGRRTILEQRSEKLALQSADVEAREFQSGRVFLTDATDPRGAARAAKAARAAGVPVIVDVDRAVEDLDSLLEASSVVIGSAGFAPSYTGIAAPGEALAALEARLAPRLVVATMGAEGSLARYRGQEIRTAAPALAVRDTTGAGDAFRGGFAAAWVRAEGTASVEALLAYANAVAALSCRGIGAQASLPVLAEVARVLGM
jgi:sulfofructose kinase